MRTLKPRQLPSQEFLRALLEYDPETGVFTWKYREGTGYGAPQFNARYAGKEAFTALCNGYRHGSIIKHRFLAHRVAWKWFYGTEPTEVDHINGVKTDNRIVNLRCVTRRENSRNQKLHRSNKTGFPGVFFLRENGLYQVMIASRHVGRFTSLDEAIAARKSAQADLGFHPNHGRKPA